jgi:hypothetical protein
VLLKCWERRNKLLGLYAPKKVALPLPDFPARDPGFVPTPEQLAAARERIIAAVVARIRGGAAGPGPAEDH